MPPSSPSKPQLAIYAAFAIAVLLVGARFLHGGGAAAPDAASFATTTSTAAGGLDGGAGAAGSGAPDSAALGASAGGGRLVVDVKGAVRRPGVYRLAPGARAYDAVRRAGGMTPRADRIGVNLAARVVDGGEVVVPARGAGGGGAPGAATTAADGAGAAGRPLSLDLDTASEQELEQLDGVGPAIAARIVAYREQHGGIGSVDELDQVSGIGDAKLAAIRAQLGR
jgi:competence protein ComEA